jgi:NADP-dependent aldehyde dehydrogenase
VPEDVGFGLVAHPLVGATAFTGGKSSGLNLKAAADRAGKPIYLELSSINPVFILPGALRQRGLAIAEELASSCLLGVGQFCTNPGVSVVVHSAESAAFESVLAQRFQAAAHGVLLGEGVVSGLHTSLQALKDAGAVVVTGGKAPEVGPCSYDNTLLRVSGGAFLEQAKALQTEAFGPVHLLVVARDIAELLAVAAALEGNLTASIYSDTGDADDSLYEQLYAVVLPKVGRLLNDKMPTGVAVSPAMHHGGPYPATGHPGFTSVGLPAAIARFVVRRCYDGVRPERLPAELQDTCPDPGLWRKIDGAWKQG